MTDPLIALAACLVGVALNALAWSSPNPLWQVFFYKVVFAVGFCIVLPTWFQARVRSADLRGIGITVERWRRDVFVGLGVLALTLPWRLGGISLPPVPDLLYLLAAMSFSCLFEEVFFRGFLQTRFEAGLGWVPAIILSAMAFSLYHVGYGAEWRAWSVLTQMILVGVMFSVAFRLTQSIVTSYVVNLPHAMVTFMERGEFFGPRAAILAAILTVAGVAWIHFLSREHSHAEQRGLRI